MRTGDLGGDLGQGGVALAVIVKALFEHDDGMCLPGPFAHEPCAGLEDDAGIERCRALCFDLDDPAVQFALRRRGETAMARSCTR